VAAEELDTFGNSDDSAEDNRKFQKFHGMFSRMFGPIVSLYRRSGRVDRKGTAPRATDGRDCCCRTAPDSPAPTCIAHAMARTMQLWQTTRGAPASIWAHTNRICRVDILMWCREISMPTIAGRRILHIPNWWGYVSHDTRILLWFRYP
jgi:hypothetical protein